MAAVRRRLLVIFTTGLFFHAAPPLAPRQRRRDDDGAATGCVSSAPPIDQPRVRGGRRMSRAGAAPVLRAEHGQQDGHRSQDTSGHWELFPRAWLSVSSLLIDSSRPASCASTASVVTLLPRCSVDRSAGLNRESESGYLRSSFSISFL